MNDTLSFSFYLIQNLFHHLVCHRIGKNHRRLKRLGLFKVHQCIRHDNNNVIRLNPTAAAPFKQILPEPRSPLMM